MMRDTSLDAYHSIKSELGKRQADVLRAIRILKSCTNQEIGNFLGLAINQITPRTGELVKMGYVTEDGTKITPSGRSAITWRVK